MMRLRFCLLLLVAWLLPLSLAVAQTADPFSACSPAAINTIICENSKSGNAPSEWDVVGFGDSSIQGYATDISVNRGDTARFKIDTAASAYRLDIYRLGHYRGLGARYIRTVRPSVSLPQVQPACLSDSSTGLVDCGNWAVSASWSVPANATSGIYIAKLVREDGFTGASHIVFIVRDDSSTSKLLFQTSDTTWQAYNSYGGNSLYTGLPAGRAYKVSYNRPFNTRGLTPYSNSWLFDAEYPMVRWLEANGYDVSYFTGVDTDRRGTSIRQHRVFLSVGHDEYWSGSQRANVEAARAAGVHLAFFSGNTMFWKTRWENSIDGSGTSYRTLVTYKETVAGAKIDPLPAVWTGTWRDPRFSPPTDGGRPENAVQGTIFTVNCCREDAIAVPEAMGKFRFWRNTSVATQSPGQTATFGSGTVGYEWDEDLNNGFRPAGSFRLSSNTLNVNSYLLDYGRWYGSGTATHSLTLYRHSSGALVFSAASVRWSWGLDNHHDQNFASTIPPPDPRMQQATVNLLADMGVQPGTLQSGLVQTTQSSDTTPPTSAITSPQAGSTVNAKSTITIAGTAADSGGVVSAVEVSGDGGTTWGRAAGRSSWTFSWVPASTGTVTILSRAIDDSGNMQNPPVAVNVTVGSAPPGTCPCTLWDNTVTPVVTDSLDTSAVELGTKFQSSVSGSITALRFYKSATNAGVNVGSLWTSTGTLLARVTYSGESAPGWQQVNLPTPVPISANTTYVVSYHTNVGHYSVDSGYFLTTGRSNPPLTAPASGSVGGNGVFLYGSVGFPNQTYNGNNYWVDVVLSTTAPTTDTTAPTVTSFTPASGATNVSTGTTVTATFSEAMNATTVNTTTVELRNSANALVSASVSYDASTRRATLRPAAALQSGITYTARVRGGSTDPRVKDLAGNALAAVVTWSFTTTAAADTTAPTVTSFTPASGATNVSTGTTVTATFSEAMNATTVNTTTVELRNSANALVSASVSYDASTRRATLRPAAALQSGITYTARVRGGSTDPRVKDLAGNALAGVVTWSFTTTAAAPGTCPCTLWDNTVTPAVTDYPDTSAVELGTKFQSSIPGWITALRFYKSATNTGVHVGSLWTSTGTLLARVTYSAESASGWQQVSLSIPVPISANTTYVVSYHTNVGHYSVDAGYFLTTGRNNLPLTAPAIGSVGGNGVFLYGAGGFPNQTYNGNNYWVDVVLSTTAP